LRGPLHGREGAQEGKGKERQEGRKRERMDLHPGKNVDAYDPETKIIRPAGRD